MKTEIYKFEIKIGQPPDAYFWQYTNLTFKRIKLTTKIIKMVIQWFDEQKEQGTMSHQLTNKKKRRYQIKSKKKKH